MAERMQAGATDAEPFQQRLELSLGQFTSAAMGVPNRIVNSNSSGFGRQFWM